MSRYRLLVLSHVAPFPRNSGQSQRVFYTLRAARQLFHLTFATVAAPDNAERVREGLSAICDEALVLDSKYCLGRTRHRAAAVLYALRTGLKTSNYAIGQLEFSPARVRSILGSRHFDCALVEYWHAVSSVPVLRERGIPCVLDMHDVLWKSYERQLNAVWIPELYRRWAVRRYRTREEQAWREFDGVIAINREELKYVQPRLPKTVRLFYAPMGVDLTQWPYSWSPAAPHRLAFYGGDSAKNREAALRCYRYVMPEIWRRFPAVELWLVGMGPQKSVRSLALDSRVKVTGFVPNVQEVLGAMSAVLCPWSGEYGFRSRLIEVMALGVPVVASADAVFGMDLQDGEGLLLGAHDRELANQALRLLADQSFAREQSQLARRQVDQQFTFEHTYGRFACELHRWLEQRGAIREGEENLLEAGRFLA